MIFLRRTPHRLAPKRSIMKYSPMNLATIVGVAHDIQFGYLPNDDPCLQFSLTHNVLDLDNAVKDPLIGNSSWARQTPSVCAKQQVTVRVVGPAPAVQDVKSSVADGTVVKVVGQLKLNQQLEGGKKQPFPFILCALPRMCEAADKTEKPTEPKSAADMLVGVVSVLHGPRARLQPAVAAAAEASSNVFKPKPAAAVSSPPK